MKRKILSILLTLAMTLTLLPATAMAEDVKGVQCDGGDGCNHKVAAIYDGSAGENPGEYHYDTLQAAITNGTNDYYGNFKLLDDVQEDIERTHHHQCQKRYHYGSKARQTDDYRQRHG